MCRAKAYLRCAPSSPVGEGAWFFVQQRLSAVPFTRQNSKLHNFVVLVDFFFCCGRNFSWGHSLFVFFFPFMSGFTTLRVFPTLVNNWEKHQKHGLQHSSALWLLRFFCFPSEFEKRLSSALITFVNFILSLLLINLYLIMFDVSFINKIANDFIVKLAGVEANILVYSHAFWIITLLRVGTAFYSFLMNISHSTYSYVALKAIYRSGVAMHIAAEQNILHYAIPEALCKALVTRT